MRKTAGKRGKNGWLGPAGEHRTALYLEKKGYYIIRQNYRCRFGEIDLIAMDPAEDILCFVEVKTRSDLFFARPCEAVTRRKAARIRKTALHFLSRCRIRCRAVRIDVAEVLFREEKFYIRYLKNVSEF